MTGVVLVTNLHNIADAVTEFNGIEFSDLKQNNQSYIGLLYRDVPTGLKDLGGWVVGNIQEGREYAIAHVKKGNQEMLWFEVLVSRDNKGKPIFQVIDVLYLPKLNKSEQIGHGGSCLQNRVRDPEIVAIAKYQDAEYWRQIKKAWRSNRQIGKFEEISPRNIVCQNPGWGV
ncbi:MAG: hypothetical protein ACRAVC_10995 [Trichormus sp.]